MRILITGATSGIGYKLGVELAKRGHIVYMCTHTVEELFYLREKLKRDNVKAISFKMDITTEDIYLVNNIKIDCLINHAGIGIGGSLLYMDVDFLRKNYEVNIFSSFKLLRLVYENMVKNKIDGKIFVTSSVAAYLPFPFLGCYTSSKAAITMLCRTIKEELKYLKSNICISIIEPGAYKTGFNQVMIDNKNKFMNKENPIYDNIESINKIQRNLFRLLEKDDYSDLVKKIIKEIEKKRSKFIIRRPLGLNIFMKFYYLFFY